MYKKIMVAMIVVGLTGASVHANKRPAEVSLEEARIQQLRRLRAHLDSPQMPDSVSRMIGLGEMSEEGFQKYLQDTRFTIESVQQTMPEMEQPSEEQKRLWREQMAARAAPPPEPVFERLPSGKTIERRGSMIIHHE